MKRELSVLLGTSEPNVEEWLRVTIEHMLSQRFDLRVRVCGREAELQDAMRDQRWGLVVLFVNTIAPEGRSVPFDGVVELTRGFKKHKGTIVIVLATFSPRGFETAAEQAGADGILDAPVDLSLLEQAIVGPLDERGV